MLKKLLVLLVLSVLFVACGPVLDGPVDDTADDDVGDDRVLLEAPAGMTEEIQPAMVDNIELEILESFPLQINAYLIGNYRNSCESLYEIHQTLEGNTIKLDFTAMADYSNDCYEGLVYFKEISYLNVDGLKAGEYEVIVNDNVSEKFTLDVDNVLK